MEGAAREGREREDRENPRNNHFPPQESRRRNSRSKVVQHLQQNPVRSSRSQGSLVRGGNIFFEKNLNYCYTYTYI